MDICVCICVFGLRESYLKGPLRKTLTGTTLPLVAILGSFNYFFLIWFFVKLLEAHVL